MKLKEIRPEGNHGSMATPFGSANSLYSVTFTKPRNSISNSGKLITLVPHAHTLLVSNLALHPRPAH